METKIITKKDTDKVFQDLVREYDMSVHHGTCDSCGERICMVAHYGYTRKDYGFRLCTKCLGRGLVIFQHPSLVEKIWSEVFKEKKKRVERVQTMKDKVCEEEI